MRKITIKFGEKGRIVLQAHVHGLEIGQRRHQGFGHKTSTVNAKMTSGIRER
jgi:hypothetical protein